MFRRLMVLFFVSGVSGALGIGVGILFAPAPGAETRAAATAFLDSHEVILDELYARASEAVDYVVSTVSAASAGAQY